MGENSRKASQAIADACLIFWTNRVHKPEWQPKSQTLKPQNRQYRIPATMRAVVYRGINDMRVETVPVPAIGPGELLIKSLPAASAAPI